MIQPQQEPEEEKQGTVTHSQMAVPTHLVTCPISGLIMENPVCVNEKDYEREAILKYATSHANKDPDGKLVTEIKPSSQMVKEMCKMAMEQ